jgi:adhesin HecA-like repeat protein
MSEELTAFAGAIAQSLVRAEITAKGINNQEGKMTTGKGADTITAEATTRGATLSQAAAFALSTAPPDNQAVAQAVAEAVAETSDEAIAIDNTRGLIRMGKGGETLEATAEADERAIAIDNTRGSIRTGKGGETLEATAEADERAIAIDNTRGLIRTGKGGETLEATAEADERAIAIDNTRGLIRTGKGGETLEATAEADERAIAIQNLQGVIRTGKGKDTIIAKATGTESDGIYGGEIFTGAGADELKASSFGGGVKIKMGRGPDWVEGFGDATLDGGQGFDTLSFGSYHKSDFQISFGSDNHEARFEFDGITMETYGFEQFIFADGNYSDDWLMA